MLLPALAALTLMQDPRPIQIKPPPSRFELSSPLALPGVMLDKHMTGVGEAQQLARAQRLQGRMLWIDATANIDRVNTETKIVELVAKIKDAGFNTIVFDVKPISGHTMYPSRIAPKMREWRGRVLPEDFDPLAVFVRESKAQGLSLLVSLNAFSEGHRMFLVGPGYDNLEWQTVLYDWAPAVHAGDQSYRLTLPANRAPEGDGLALFTDAARMPTAREGLFTVTVRTGGEVVDGFAMGGIGPGVPTIPAGGLALVGSGAAAAWLQANAVPGKTLDVRPGAEFVPISQRPEQQIPLMVNPNSPVVQERALAILEEVVANYAVDGVLYDDRFRYGGLNADFSPLTRTLFESYVGRRLAWPQDVYQYTFTSRYERGIRPGPYYDAWLVWRALQMRNYLARARAVVTRRAPVFGLYVGSWYGEYPALGNNYAAPEAEAGFWFATPEYQRTGLAPLNDLIVTGAYYPTSTVYEAMEENRPIGPTVEAAGALTNRLVRDAAWTYTGIMLSDFKGNPEGLGRAMQAACGASQGVMVFDLSHDIEPFWPVFKQAFSQPREAPHAHPKALAEVRRRRENLDRLGVKLPPIIIAAGTSGAGQ